MVSPKLITSLALFLALSVSGYAQETPGSPASTPIQVTTPEAVKADQKTAYEYIGEQWWTENALISVHQRPEHGTNPKAGATWITQEDRNTGVSITLATPAETRDIGYANGVLCAWAFHYYEQPGPMGRIKSIEEISKESPDFQKASEDAEVGHLYRCVNFKTWELVMTFKPTRYFNIFRVEPLIDNRLFFLGLFPTKKERGEYTIGSINADGQVSIDAVVKTSGLDSTGWNQPFFDHVARTQNHLIHYSKGHGYLRIFNGRTGEFQRLVRCWEYPKETAMHQTNIGLADDIILALKARPDGRLLVASRSLDFAKNHKVIELPHNRFVRKSGSAFMKEMRKNSKEEHDALERLTKQFPEVIWRVLDPETGTWSPAEPPPGAKTRLNSSSEAFPFKVDYYWDGSFRF